MRENRCLTYYNEYGLTILFGNVNDHIEDGIKQKRGIIMEDEKEEPYYQAVSTAIAAIEEQICADIKGQIVYLMVVEEDNDV